MLLLIYALEFSLPAVSAWWGGMEAIAKKGADRERETLHLFQPPRANLLQPHVRHDTSDHSFSCLIVNFRLLAAMQVLGVKEYHRSCTENLHEGLSELGLVPPEVSALLTQAASIPARHSGTPMARALMPPYTHASAPMMQCDDPVSSTCY